MYGTKGKLVVNQNPALNRVTICDEHGVRSESTPTYYERFHEAFVQEVRDFTSCILDDKGGSFSCPSGSNPPPSADFPSLSHSYLSQSLLRLWTTGSKRPRSRSA